VRRTGALTVWSCRRFAAPECAGAANPFLPNTYLQDVQQDDCLSTCSTVSTDGARPKIRPRMRHAVRGTRHVGIGVQRDGSCAPKPPPRGTQHAIGVARRSEGECQHPVGHARKRALDFPSTRSIPCPTGRNARLAYPERHCSAAARLSPASPPQIMCTQCRIPVFMELQILEN